MVQEVLVEGPAYPEPPGGGVHGEEGELVGERPGSHRSELSVDPVEAEVLDEGLALSEPGESDLRHVRPRAHTIGCRTRQPWLPLDASHEDADSPPLHDRHLGVAAGGQALTQVDLERTAEQVRRAGVFVDGEGVVDHRLDVTRVLRPVGPVLDRRHVSRSGQRRTTGTVSKPRDGKG